MASKWFNFAGWGPISTGQSCARPRLHAWITPAARQSLQSSRTMIEAVAGNELAQTKPVTACANGPALHDLAHLVDCSADCILQFDGNGFLTYMNAAARREFAQVRGEVQQHWKELLAHQAGSPLLRRMQVKLLRHGRWDGELSLSARSTSERLPFQVLVIAHRSADGSVRSFSAWLRNVAAERQAQQQIQRQTDILQAITEAVPATVVVVDREGRYRFANEAFARYCGRPKEQILGRRPAEVLGPEEVARRRELGERAYAGETVTFTLEYPGETGNRWLSVSCIPLKLNGVVDGIVGISQDVTQQHLERQRLTQLAECDPLTGLLNRAGFEQGVECLVQTEALDSASLLFIDLDHFKPVNDRYGHLVGDRLLQMFAKRLKGSVRATDLVARLGGDEFAVLLPSVRDEAQALLVADKILAAASEPFEIDGCVLAVTTSIGIAFGLKQEAGWRELVARADALLYRAKATGRGRAAHQAPAAFLAARNRGGSTCMD
jgi:diguanylate cyclase (GGDEF)-like protein/PAS domain S-box-containing protein